MDGHIRMKKRRQSRTEKVGVAIAVCVILGLAGFILWADEMAEPEAPVVDERAATLADILPMQDLLADGDHGWVGGVLPGWPGLSDPAALRRACDAALVRLGASDTQTLTIMGDDGLPAIECGVPINGTLGGPPAPPPVKPISAAAPAPAPPGAPSAGTAVPATPATAER